MRIKKTVFFTSTLLFFSTIFILDTIFALAGRNVLIIKCIPNMSLFFAIMFFSFGMLVYLHVFWQICVKKNWIALFIFLMIFLGEIIGGFFLYNHLCRKSYEEARKIVIGFLQHPQNYDASYDEGIGLDAVTEIGTGKNDIVPVYVFHAHGRYVFTIKSKNKELFFVQLNRGLERNEFFVLSISRFPEFKQPLPPSSGNPVINEAP